MKRLLCLLVLTLVGGAAGACAKDSAPEEVRASSTRERTLVDADGDGRLERGPGEPLRARRDLTGGRGAADDAARGHDERSRAQAADRPVTFVQLSDLHIRDEESPARVPFLDRLGDPFTSTFRPHEALSAHLAAATVRAVNRLEPEAVVVTGDFLDSAQANELDSALAVLDGGRVLPDSGARGYDGVQEAGNPDPLYYRPDTDAPRRPGLVRRAQEPFVSPGLDAPWLPVLGNHDVLVQGEIAPTAALDDAARGRRMVESLAPEAEAPRADADPAQAVRAVLDGRVATRDRRVPGDERRRHLTPADTARRLGRSLRGGRLDYAADIGRRVRALVLDTARRDGGSSGVVSARQVAWLERELKRSGSRWSIVFSHHPLESAAGGEDALRALDRAPRVAAAVSGHRHRNTITPRRTSGGGYWLIGTASLADFPQQARAFFLREDADGDAVLETWMVDHDGAGLAGDARALAFLDVQGGRPRRFAGAPEDRNVGLELPRPPS